MLFPTPEFALFFSIVFVGSWLLRPRRTPWRWFILAASYVFYGWWDPRFTLLLAGSTLVNQAGALAIGRARNPITRRGALAAVVAANLGVLGFFKYYGFFVTSVADNLTRLGLGLDAPLLDIVLPVGISFFTFQALSYVIDVYRGDEAPAGLLDFAVYLSLFPQVVAGPIVRARELIPQLRERPDPRRVHAPLAIRLIFAGLFKKMVVSSYVATGIVDPVFANPGRFTNLEILFAAYGYAVQIYADFSGYTDIAIGCALLLGLRFPQNFAAPYTARSVQDFWRRWHMTLSSWLRDYLYIPLGGNRGGQRRMERNLAVTMLLGGLWHGAAWTFVVWGGLHGLALIIEQRWERARAASGVTPGRWSPVLRWLVTFHVVTLAWIFFRADTFADAGELVWRLLTAWGVGSEVSLGIVATVVAMVAVQFVPEDVVLAGQRAFARAAPAVQGVGLALGFLVLDALGPTGVAPFIYFQF